MVRTLTNSFSIISFILLSTAAQAATIFACEPEWGAIVKILMPDAKLYSATSYLQDPHHIEARPALIAQLRSADLAVCTGASLEAGWLPVLQERAGNPRVQDGKIGLFLAANQVKLINPTDAISTPFSGDVHKEGNPHLQTDPRYLLKVSDALLLRMIKIWPAEEATLRKNHQQFSARLQAKIKEWEKRAAPLKGTSIAAQHASFGYLWRWLGIHQTLDLEPKPGVAPTPGHLRQVLAHAKSQPISLIAVASHQDPRPAKWLAQQLDNTVPLVILPTTLPSNEPDALFAWFDGIINQLTSAIKK